MIKLNVSGHDDICGGYCYSGTASFEGSTVAEVLQEIREFARNRDAHYLGEGFGNPKSDFCNAWGIRINGIPYVGDWNGWQNKYRHEYDEEKVIEVRVSGGWYCFYDFYIDCEETEKSEKVILANKLADKEAAELEEAEVMKMFGL